MVKFRAASVAGTIAEFGILRSRFFLSLLVFSLFSSKPFYLKTSFDGAKINEHFADY